MTENERYFGSIRFFKNLILLAVILLIGAGAGFSIYYHSLYRDAQEQIESLCAGGCEDRNPAANREDAPAYQSLYPDFYAPQPYAATQVAEKTIYLTFEDGPSVRTPEILSILAQWNVQATFFVNGSDNAASAQWMKEIADAGHTIGMHSWSNDYAAIYQSVEDYLADMYHLFTYIKDTTGITPTVFRFPGGSINSYNAGIYQELIGEMIRRGFVPYDWNLSVQDEAGTGNDAQELVNNLLKDSALLDRGVVMLHDSADKYSTVSALPILLIDLTAQGFRLDKLTPDVKPILFDYPE